MQLAEKQAEKQSSEAPLQPATAAATKTTGAAQAAGTVAIERALQQPTSARDAAAQFVGALRGAETPAPISHRVFRSQVVSASTLASGNAKVLMDKARAKLDELPFYVKVQLTIHELSLAADEQPRGEDGTRRFRVNFKGQVVASSMGIEVKNSTRTESGIIAVDATSLRIVAFELPFMDKLRGDAALIAPPKKEGGG